MPLADRHHHDGPYTGEPRHAAIGTVIVIRDRRRWSNPRTAHLPDRDLLETA